MLLLMLGTSLTAWAQEKENNYLPEIHGTIRAKYEYQPDMNAGRFEVRNARFSLSGKVIPWVAYKAEIDLCDEGNIKMLDAYTRLSPWKNFQATIGQMRVPFTIDAHRSPHQQYFANRSFIAKQVGNVRDVGLTLGYKWTDGIPLSIEGGLFNGSGLTNQKDYWTKEINFSTKMQIYLPGGFNVTLSMQKIKPEAIAEYLYDAGIYYHSSRWHIEAEYLSKHYQHKAFNSVNAFDGFVCYDLPLRHKFFSKISFLGRFDYMDNHSDGMAYLDGQANPEGQLIINDSRRNRITGGLTISLGKPFISDIRINYEKYHYPDGAKVKISEQDKLVIEVMTRF